MRDLTLTKSPQLGLGRGGARGGDHPSADHFAQARIGDAEHLHLINLRIPQLFSGRDCLPRDRGARDQHRGHGQAAISAQPPRQAADYPFRLFGPGDSTSYLKARTALSVYQAQERQLSVQRKKGLLVDRARAETLMFRLARRERDIWVTWRARVAALRLRASKLAPPRWSARPSSVIWWAGRIMARCGPSLANYVKRRG